MDAPGDASKFLSGLVHAVRCCRLAVPASHDKAFEASALTNLPPTPIHPAGGGALLPPVEVRLPERGRHAVYAHPTRKGTASMTTNLTEQHRRACNVLTSGEHTNLARFSVFVNIQPAAAIVSATAHELNDEGGETEFHIEPQFISIVDGPET